MENSPNKLENMEVQQKHQNNLPKLFSEKLPKFMCLLRLKDFSKIPNELFYVYSKLVFI